MITEIAAALIILAQLVLIVKRFVIGDWNPKAVEEWKELNKMRDECDRLFIVMNESCSDEEKEVRFKVYTAVSKLWRDRFVAYSKKYLRNKNRFTFIT